MDDGAEALYLKRANIGEILPLSHKSSRLCWGRPLAVSDAFGDDFFEILSVFWVEIHSFFFS